MDVLRSLLEKRSLSGTWSRRCVLYAAHGPGYARLREHAYSHWSRAVMEITRRTLFVT
ncbi:hypothetical protein GBAR_LOCUS23560 [Geodia barretti]|uniref:Uncharacterized protein n=1 Tax=Geodia barretti TaxID=519541 RepID=A0AA35X999_GEOBA|nr:hypothetical protein GBAR_LOCUS23560 [Geodia barretti]